MRRIPSCVMLVFVTLLTGSSFADKDAYDIASVKALDHQLWEAWRNSPDGKSILMVRRHFESDVVLLRDTPAAAQ